MQHEIYSFWGTVAIKVNIPLNKVQTDDSSAKPLRYAKVSREDSSSTHFQNQICQIWKHKQVMGPYMQKAKLVPILVAILQQVLHSYWRNTLNLQLAGSTASWCPGKHGLNKSIRRFSIKLTLWVGDILESQVHFLLERKVGEKLDLLCIGPACVPVLRICWWTLCLCFTISYDEIFDGLPPAPQLVYSHDVEVRHVGVIEQVVHSVPHGCGSGLENIFHSLNHQIQVSDKPVICLYKCTEHI